MNTCRRRNTANLKVSSNNESDENNDKKVQEKEQHEDFWNTVPGRIFQKYLEEAYNQIVYWRKNIFMVPTGATGKKFIDEISRLLNL